MLISWATPETIVPEGGHPVRVDELRLVELRILLHPDPCRDVPDGAVDHVPAPRTDRLPPEGDGDLRAVTPEVGRPLDAQDGIEPDAGDGGEEFRAIRRRNEQGESAAHQLLPRVAVQLDGRRVDVEDLRAPPPEEEQRLLVLLEELAESLLADPQLLLAIPQRRLHPLPVGDVVDRGQGSDDLSLDRHGRGVQQDVETLPVALPETELEPAGHDLPLENLPHRRRVRFPLFGRPVRVRDPGAQEILPAEPGHRAERIVDVGVPPVGVHRDNAGDQAILHRPPGTPSRPEASLRSVCGPGSRHAAPR